MGVSPKLDTATEASRVYDVIYGPIASKLNYRISNATKSSRVEKILSTLEFEERTVIRATCKYQNYAPDMIAKITKMDKARILKVERQARRHMYSPSNIRVAIPKFYKIDRKLSIYDYKLTPCNFGGMKYVVTALNKAGITTKGELCKHLSLGWYFLYTIPGCGDMARIAILETFDAWANE